MWHQIGARGYPNTPGGIALARMSKQEELETFNRVDSITGDNIPNEVIIEDYITNLNNGGIPQVS